MQRLVQEGLVRSELNRGLFVKELGEEDIRDLYVARTAIETAAARTLSREGSAESVERLRGASRQMQQAAEKGDLPALSDATSPSTSCWWNAPAARACTGCTRP